MITMISSEG